MLPYHAECLWGVQVKSHMTHCYCRVPNGVENNGCLMKNGDLKINVACVNVVVNFPDQKCLHASKVNILHHWNIIMSHVTHSWCLERGRSMLLWSSVWKQKQRCRFFPIFNSVSALRMLHFSNLCISPHSYIVSHWLAYLCVQYVYQSSGPVMMFHGVM